MGKININYQNGGIGGVVGSTDFISGFIFDSTSLPTGYVSGTSVALYSIKDAENIGITDLATDETKATGGTVLIGTGYAVGETISINVTPLNSKLVTIGSYTVKTTDTSATIATELANAINLAGNKWTASSVLASAVVTLVAPTGLGASINGADIVTVTGSTSLVKTVTNFTGGVGSQIALMHYTLDSYFTANSNTKAWIKIVDYTSAFDADTIKSIQTQSGGEIRQLGILTKKGLDGVTAIVTASNAACLDQASKKKPLSVVIGLQKGTATLATLANLRTLTCSRVSITISNSYGVDSLGYNLKGITSYYPTDLGAVLGHISRSKVSNSIAWVQNNVTENADVMLVTGEAWSDIEDTTKPDELAAKGYIFERKYFGYAGSYFDNDSVADALTSDYDSVKRMRTMDKVARVAYFSLVPYLSSPLILDATSGTISQATVIKFNSIVSQAISPMLTASEVSGYSVYINPAQNVLANKEIVIAITIVPIGSADEITVNLGYALQLA